MGILLSLVTPQGRGAGKGALTASSFRVPGFVRMGPTGGAVPEDTSHPQAQVTCHISHEGFSGTSLFSTFPHTQSPEGVQRDPGTHPCADAPLRGQLLSLSPGPVPRELPVRVGEHPMSKNEGVEGKGSAHSVSLWDLSSGAHSGTVAHKSPASLSFLSSGPHCPTLPPLSPGIASYSDLQRLFQESPELRE